MPSVLRSALWDPVCSGQRRMPCRRAWWCPGCSDRATCPPGRCGDAQCAQDRVACPPGGRGGAQYAQDTAMCPPGGRGGAEGSQLMPSDSARRPWARPLVLFALLAPQGPSHVCLLPLLFWSETPSQVAGGSSPPEHSVLAVSGVHFMFVSSAQEEII